MGVATYEFDCAAAVAPNRLFKALILDADSLFPKVFPQGYNKIENVSGCGGPGTVKKAVLPNNGSKVYQIDLLDAEKLEFGLTIVEGDMLGDSFEKISYEVKIVKGPNGGSIIKSTAKYFIKGDSECNHAHAEGDKEKYTGLFKAVENHLLALPEAYA